MPDSPSPFARPAPGLPVREFVLRIPRPTPGEVVSYPAAASDLLDATGQSQAETLAKAPVDLRWIEGRHFLLAGGTGSGLGGSLATLLLKHLSDAGSLTIVARDLKKSVEFEMGRAMQERAEAAGLGARFRWLNDGLAREGEPFHKLVAALREVGADRVVYINTVAAASSGLLPGLPPVYVKDVGAEGLFQWQLRALNDRAVEATKFLMGTLAVTFPYELEKAGFAVEISAFADWRGSLDGCSRNPQNVEYGRQGPYSTSLYLPKRIIQEAASAAYRSGRLVIDCFFPVMRTRALSLIPGGTLMDLLYDSLMKRAGIRRFQAPHLAVAMLDRIGPALVGGYENPFPRFDLHDASIDLWFFEVLQRLNNDAESDFYYKRWIDLE